MPEYIGNYLNAIAKFHGTKVYADNIMRYWNDIESANVNNDIKSLDIAYENLTAEATACEAYLREHKIPLNS